MNQGKPLPPRQQRKKCYYGSCSCPDREIQYRMVEGMGNQSCHLRKSQPPRDGWLSRQLELPSLYANKCSTDNAGDPITS